jgi:hypothetical protein
MKQHVDRSIFVNTFDQYGRGNNFTIAAREALFDYFEELEEDAGREIEFDCIAICSDWSEYPDPWVACDEYCGDTHAELDTHDAECEDEINDKALDWLRDRTQVIEFDGGVLVR